jgi:hypothetical protein
VNPVPQAVGDTKNSGASGTLPEAKAPANFTFETPEAVMEKVHRQATHLGPVMEEILRTMHGPGRSHWGLNE